MLHKTCETQKAVKHNTSLHVVIKLQVSNKQQKHLQAACMQLVEENLIITNSSWVERERLKESMAR